MHLSQALRAGLALAVMVAGGGARAEHGKLNLNLDLGVSSPLTGKYGTEINGKSSAQAYGPHLLAALDYHLAGPLAVELQGSFGLLIVPPFDLRVNDNPGKWAFVPTWSIAVGPRFRFFNDTSGYGEEKNADTASHLWASLHAGLHGLEGAQFGLDAAVGYQWNLKRPFNLGPFFRGAVLFPGANALRGASVLLTLGLSGTWELIPLAPTAAPVQEAPAVDTKDSDRDGLTDSYETNTSKTDPLKTDTDDDGLSDEVEVRTKTNPLVADTDGDSIDDAREDVNHNGVVDVGETNPRAGDTDGDGLRDDVEDANHNGVRDADETDPTVADTDKDSLLDGAEDANHNAHVDAGETDPRLLDTDGDGVPDGGSEEVADHCPLSKGPAETHGCPQEKLVEVTKYNLVIMERVYFDTNQSTIQKRSYVLLNQVANVINDHPEIASVLVEGHTDDVGDEAKNMALSQDRADAVKAYLIGRKVAASRLKAVGFGTKKPAVEGTTPEAREKNRRVEFNISKQ